LKEAGAKADAPVRRVAMIAVFMVDSSRLLSKQKESLRLKESKGNGFLH
jgi:hypothetical protein